MTVDSNSVRIESLPQSQREDSAVYEEIDTVDVVK